MPCCQSDAENAPAAVSGLIAARNYPSSNAKRWELAPFIEAALVR
jgi:hypothetical protein